MCPHCISTANRANTVKIGTEFDIGGTSCYSFLGWGGGQKGERWKIQRGSQLTCWLGCGMCQHLGCCCDGLCSGRSEWLGSEVSSSAQSCSQTCRYSTLTASVRWSSVCPSSHWSRQLSNYRLCFNSELFAVCSQLQLVSVG